MTAELRDRDAAGNDDAEQQPEELGEPVPGTVIPPDGTAAVTEFAPDAPDEGSGVSPV
ncbi:hypothetical protein [Herbiconiux sp. L3-i23]|uniref:hypothetical protein n=1 Tax=Herbiconiux sp. L3-i23 TaxID=2905871 RepID=UPI00204A2F16|nr:hypothetical protein [Herbiconiux sp. L3-i23]BDI22466.1 hypothetical protein L3i23_12420 [Herbiconiux sp. L3-i23]